MLTVRLLDSTSRNIIKKFIRFLDIRHVTIIFLMAFVPSLETASSIVRLMETKMGRKVMCLCAYLLFAFSKFSPLPWVHCVQKKLNILFHVIRCMDSFIEFLEVKFKIFANKSRIL